MKRAMETPITVTQRELLSLAPEVRARVADVTVKKRVDAPSPRYMRERATWSGRVREVTVPLVRRTRKRLA